MEYRSSAHICLLVFHTCSVHTLMIGNFLSVAGVPAVESSSHTQIESSIANTNMDPSPSSSIPDRHSAYQYQGSCFSLAVVPSTLNCFLAISLAWLLGIPSQGTRLAGQEQFSSISLNGSFQEPVGRPNSCSWTTKVSNCCLMTNSLI